MANVTGTLATALIIQEALDLVFTERPILNEISLDLKPEAVKFNQQVLSRTHAIPAVQNFGAIATDKADVDVPVTVDQFKQVRYAFTIQEISSTDRNLVRETARPMAIAIANYMVDAIAALWVAASFTDSTIALVANTNYSTLVTLRKALIGRGVQGQRFVAANADVYEKLLNDTTVIAALNNAGHGGAITTGKLPGVAGFNIYEYPALPVTGNMTAFAASKDSTVLATRVPKDPRELIPGLSFAGNMGVVTHPSGFSVMVVEYIDPATLTVDIRLIWMFGAARGNGNNGQILKTS